MSDSQATTGPDPWLATHDEADQAGLDGYLDPRSGLFVMTRGYLVRRGACCSNLCRHCPYPLEPRID